MSYLRPLNLLLLAAAWLLAALGLYASLLTGLAPGLGGVLLAGWTLLAGLVYRWARVTPPRAQPTWRQALPTLFLLLSFSCFGHTFAQCQKLYGQQPGYPRRYYSQPAK